MTSEMAIQYTQLAFCSFFVAELFKYHWYLKVGMLQKAPPSSSFFMFAFLEQCHDLLELQVPLYHAQGGSDVSGSGGAVHEPLKESLADRQKHTEWCLLRSPYDHPHNVHVGVMVKVGH